ncbi:chromosome partitioning protein ParA [Terrimonas sp.]|uniref:ROK family protein n=1 Tax=Terrimonas sp. TaxID=1914338 RepID=UPI000D5134B4|nr:ROK family protein [Terrimonas sp.]PVD53329.1 chromosome partitioning protein ParA [Terrimonas sp.]
MATQRILCIDIGGSNIKATVLDTAGKIIEPYQKLPTPTPSTPQNVLKTIQQLVNGFPAYQKISVGFPGYVKHGVVMTAPNLGTPAWAKFDLQGRVAKLLKKPCIVVNDADMQGLGIARGKGFEIVVTLGTGFGTAFLYEGTLLPHLEFAHHPVWKNDWDYDKYIGEKAFKKEGVEKWNKRIQRVIGILKTVFNYDHLYIGGGNAKQINFKLDKNITIVTNKEGIKGGPRLWQKKK